MEYMNLTLSGNDVGQLIEGLDVLVEQWDATADFLETGNVREDTCIRESHDPHEARDIASTYREIRHSIRRQMPIPSS